MVLQQHANSCAPQQNAAMALSVDSRSTVFPSNSREDLKLQAPTSDSDFDAINGQLLTAYKAIEATRTKLWSVKAVAERDRTLRLECSGAYKRLHTQYERTVQDLHDTSSKCVTLHNQLDEARGIISTHYEKRLDNHASAQRAEHEAARAGQLESTVRQLEAEKADIAQKLHLAEEYQVAFSNASSRLNAAEQRIGKLEKEKEAMAHDHQFALATAANRTSAAEGKIDEHEQQCGSPDHILSPTVGKRQTLDEVPRTKLEPAPRGRKRKAVAVM